MRAFTLVELLVVIGIMVLLMGIIVATYQSMSAQNRRSACAANLKAIGQALAIFRDDYKCFPPDATEYLWTEAAVYEYRRLYGQDPPGESGLGTLVGAAYHPEGKPFAPDPSYSYYKTEDSAIRGLGLFTLYYLGAYATTLPPESSDWRLYQEYGRPRTELKGKALKDLDWFRGSGYLDNLNVFHCPANPAELTGADVQQVRQSQDKTAPPDDPEPTVPDGLPDTPGISFLNGWNNYDQYYRRNYWGNEFGGGAPTTWSRNTYGKRDLFDPYPSKDTVVTWCPHHRRSVAPRWPGNPYPNDQYRRNPQLRDGDMDIVLFADGSVRRMTAQQDNRMFEEPTPDASWPQGPIM